MAVFDVKKEEVTETPEQREERLNKLVAENKGKFTLRQPMLHTASDMPADYTKSELTQSRAGIVNHLEDSVKYIKESNIWKNLFNTPQDKLIEAKSFTDKYGVPTEVILQGGNDALDNLRAMDNTYETNKKIFGQEGKQFSLDNLYELYPEMKTIVDKDTNSAVLALKNMQNVQETKGIFDSIVTGYNRMQDYIKRGDIGARMALGEDTPELQAELTRLEDNLKKYRTTDGFSHPLEKILGETAAQGGMMLTQYTRGASVGVVGGALAGAVIGGATTGGLGAVPGAVAGMKYGADVGFAEEMFRNSTGNKYLDNIQRGLDKNMSRKQALTYGAIDTAIEFVATKYMAKAVGKVTPNSALKEIMNNASERVALARGSLTTMLKTSGKVGGSELLEEGLQDVNDKLQDNAYGVKRNSLGDIIEGAVGAMIDAVPSVVGLGLLGGVGGNVKSIRNIINASDGMKKVVVQQEINNIGANVLNQLKENQSSNSLFKKSPEVYAQVVQTQADKIGMGTMYVDVEVAMQSDKGVNALNKMVENGVVKEEQLKQAIETGGTLEVPVGEYMQKVAPNVEDNALHEATAWTDGGINLGKLKMMQEYYSNIQQRIAKEQENTHNQVVNELLNEHFKDSDVALDVLNKNVFDLKRSYLDTQRHAEEVFNELVGMKRFKEGMGQGVTIIPTEDGKGVKASNNAKWYSDFYDQNKRKPTNYELRRLALENLSEEVYQQAKTEEERARADEALNEAQTQLEYLDKLEGLKDKFYELADSDYILRKTLSKEGLEVYKDIQLTLSNGNKSIKEQSKESAYLFAKHADVMAKYMQNAGIKDYTAKDYAKQHGIQIGGELPAGAMKQLNEGVDPDRGVQVVNLDSAFAKKANNSIKDLRQYVKSLAGQQISTADKDIIISIVGGKKAEHVAASGAPVSKALFPVRGAAVRSITDLIKNAVLVESTPNAKKIELTAEMSASKRRSQKEKNKIDFYHRFYVPIEINGKIHTVRIVAEESGAELTIPPEEVNLYDVIIEKKNPSAQTPTEVVISDAERDSSITISIRQMLSGVKDAEGNAYFQRNDIANTPAFKRWFGDSKVVDEEGKPLVVYHGTGAKIEAFDPSFTGKGNDQLGSGFYFTTKKDEANGYETRRINGEEEKIGGEDNPNTLSLYLNIKNPIVVKGESLRSFDFKLTKKKIADIISLAPNIMDKEESPLGDFVEEYWEKGPSKAMINKVAEQYLNSPITNIEGDFFRDDATAFRHAVHEVLGYDGVVKDFGNGHKHYVAWFPEQIKSVDNKGTFNPNDVNIYNQKVDNIIRDSKQLYDEVVNKFPDIVEDRRVKKRVENALQTTLDFGELPNEIIKQTSASDFGGQGGEKSQNEKRKNNSVRNNERIGEQIALGVTRKLVNEGAISLVGHKVNNVRELAELAQVLRHPGYEKFHRIYTNDNNEIIHHETVSCMMPSEASILSPEDDGKLSNLFGRMDNEIREKGANKVYLIHNHPSTNPTPSANDIEVTKNIANLTTSDGKTSIISEKFAGHIILDTDKYCEIKKDGSFDFGKIDEQYQIKMTDAELPSINLGKVVNSPSAIADLAKNLFDTSKTTAFLMTTKNEVRGVFQLPQQLTTLSKDKILRYLRWLSRSNYSSRMAIVTENENDYNSLLPLVEKGHILDMMLTKPFGEEFARSKVEVKRTSGWMGIPSGENAKRLLEESETYNQSAEQLNRGSLTVYNTGKTMMQLFKSADYSTFIHESGHLFLEDIRALAELENAPKEIKQAWKTVKEWTGWVEGANNTEAHEKFAKGFEAYVREGKAPSNDLKAVFRKFKAWLVQVYENLTRLGEVPPKEIQRIMDMMIATDTEIENYVDTQDISSFNKKGFGNLEGNDKEIVKRWKQETIEKIKERVHGEFMKSYTEQARQEKAEFLERYRVDIERKLIEKNKFYEIENLYKEFGKPVLDKYGITKDQLQEELNKLGGNLDYAVDMKVLEEEKEIDNTIIKGEELKRFADEYLLSDEGQSKIVALERDEMQRRANAVTSEIMKAMRLLNADEIDVKEVSKVINDLFGTEKSKTNNLKAQLFGKSEEINKLKEQLNELTGNDENKKFVISELKDQLNDNLRKLRMVRDATTGNQQLMMEQARRILSQSNISEAIAFKSWQQKAIVAGKQADAFLVKGDFEKAMYRKNDQLLYLSMAKVAHDNEKRINKAVEKLKTNNERISRSEKPIRLGGQERYFYQHLMYKIGLRNDDVLEPTSGFDMKVIKGALNPDVAIGITEDDGGVISRWVENVFYDENPINWRKLRLEQFEEISTLLGAIYKVGRREYEGSTILDENGNSMSFEDASNALMLGLSELDKPSVNRLQEYNSMKLKGEVGDIGERILLELTKPETIFNRIDGGKAGVWYNLLYRPIERGANKERELMRDANKTLKKIMSRYSAKELRTIRSNRKYQVGKITGFTKEQIMVLALNWGTENNKQRVIGGLNANGAGIDVVDIERVLGEVLTNKDWDFIEDTWKLINSYWQERNDVQERLYGVPLGKEEAVSFTINGREMSGGYYPIVYDGRLSVKASEQDINEIVKQQLSSNAVFGVGMGSTKKRAAKVDRMLLLSFDVIPKAVTEAVHHVSMRECSVDVYKLLSRKEVETAIIDKFGIESYKVLKQWSRDNWQTEVKRMGLLEKAVNALKRNTTFATLAYRTSTAIINASNIFPMAKELGGVANAVKALYGFYNATNESYKNNRQFVLNKSSFLAERVHNLDKDMTEGLKIGGKQGRIMDGKDEINRYAYYFITETDLMLSLPLWKQTYETTVGELLKTKTDHTFIESEAIAKADRAVRRVFGSGETKDLSSIQKKQGFLSFITPFYTYCNTVLNSLIEAGYQVKDKGNVMPLFNAMLFWIVLPTMVETLIRSSYDSDDDDLKTIAKKYGINLGRNAMGGIPLVRDISDMTLTYAMGEQTFSKGNTIMALSIGEKFYNLVNSVKSDKKDWVDVGRSASQVGNRVVGFSDTLTDGFWSLMKFTFTDTNASVTDLIQAIIFDKKVQEKKKKK